MNPRLPENRRGPLNLSIRDGLRDLNVQLALLSQRVSGHLDLKGADLQCLDLIDTRGPLSPSALARLAGLHPATMTGVIFSFTTFVSTFKTFVLAVLIKTAPD